MHLPHESGGLRAVVLAAGDGDRLGQHTENLPKPLVPVGRRPLIDYTLEALAAAGIASAIVVTGYREAELRAALRESVPCPDVTFVSNPDYHCGASFSLRAARPLVEHEPFLLVVSDHLFDPRLIRRLVDMAELDSSLVACDFRPAAYHDIAEATRIRAARLVAGPPLVTDIGKTLEPFDALDTGAFLLQPEIWRAVDAAPDDCELSAIMSELVESARLFAADVTGEFWFDVDTVADLAVAARLVEERRARS